MSFSVKLQYLDGRCTTLFEKELQRYVTQIFQFLKKKNYMGEPMRRNLCVAVFFSNIAGIDSRPATLLKKGFHQLDLPGNTLALLQKSLS